MRSKLLTTVVVSGLLLAAGQAFAQTPDTGTAPAAEAPAAEAPAKPAKPMHKKHHAGKKHHAKKAAPTPAK